MSHGEPTTHHRPGYRQQNGPACTGHKRAHHHDAAATPSPWSWGFGLPNPPLSETILGAWRHVQQVAAAPRHSVVLQPAATLRQGAVKGTVKTTGLLRKQQLLAHVNSGTKLYHMPSNSHGVFATGAAIATASLRLPQWLQDSRHLCRRCCAPAAASGTTSRAELSRPQDTQPSSLSLSLSDK